MKNIFGILVFISVIYVEDANQLSDFFCHTIKSSGSNLRYCNINTIWEPRMSKAALTAILTLLSLASALSCLYIVFKVAPKINANYSSLSDINRCCQILCFPVYVLLPIFSLLWDAVDAIIDAYTFQQLESGKIIDPVIYRNVHVNNAILVFTILGVLKMFFIMWVFLRSHKHFEINKKEDLANIKRGIILLTFLAEDSIQLFLEYFYISKYFTNSPGIFLVFRDIGTAIIAVCTLSLDLKEVFNKETDRYRRILFGIIVLIGVTELLRMVAVIEQCISLTLHRDCFHVTEGKLLQTPFNTSCLKHIDYAILVLGVISLIGSVYVIVIPLKMLSMKKERKDDEIFSTAEEDTETEVKEEK